MKTSIAATTAISYLIAVASAGPTLLARQDDSCPVDAISCSSSSSADSCCVPNNGLMVHVQQWVPGYGPSDAFTMHGLFADTCSGGIPGHGNSGCDPSRNYHNIAYILEDNDPELYNAMKDYWPSSKGDDGKFWEHEFSKHGTCVSTYDPKCYGSDYKKYQDVIDYFRKVLDIRSEYDLYAILNEAGISPGGSYHVSDIEDAIKSKTGAVPRVTCKGGNINEIWLFFHVKGNGEYVPTDSYGHSTCHGSVNFPPK